MISQKNNVFQNKIDFINYLVNIALLTVNFIFSIFYIYEKIYPLACISILFTCVYLYYTFKEINNSKIFGYISYLGVVVHGVAAIICINFKAGYYLWLYALVCAFFLPSFGDVNKATHNRPFYIGFLYAVVYFFISFLNASGRLEPIYILSDSTIKYLFTFNSSLVFLTIIGFTYFYTTKVRIKEEFLEYKADNDLLTNLKNRRAINQIIDERINNGVDEFSVAIMDIDYFKKVNDTYGHNAGDHILIKIAEKLKKLEAYGIISARWGGEEFLIVGPKDMDHKDFIEILKDLLKNIKDTTFKYEKKEIKITVSIGASRYKSYKKIQKIIEEADINLYRAKDEGRNRILY